MEKSTTCLSERDFLNDWDHWKNTVNLAIKTTRKIGISDKLIEIASVRVSEFFAERLFVEPEEEALIKDLWTVATPQERKTLGELLFKVMDKSTKESGNQELDEPYGGY